MNSSTTSPEVQLIQRCIEGDRKASFVLYHRYARQMLNVAYRIIKDEEAAKDVLQDAFLKAFRQMNQLQNPAGFGGWLKKIVVHTAINQVQKKGLHLVSLTDVIHDPAAPPPEKEEDKINEFNLQLAKAALMELPDGYRTVLSLYLIEGYDHQEIAEILGINKSTSLSQYSRGKKKLHSIIIKKKEDGLYRR